MLMNLKLLFMSLLQIRPYNVGSVTYCISYTILYYFSIS